MSEWGYRIKQRRQQLGFSVTKLARLCQLKSPSIHDWESGKTKQLRGESLLAAAKALQCEPAWILGGKNVQPSLAFVLPDGDRANSPRREEVEELKRDCNQLKAMVIAMVSALSSERKAALALAERIEVVAVAAQHREFLDLMLELSKQKMPPRAYQKYLGFLASEHARQSKTA